jgi:acyl carrier protein
MDTMDREQAKRELVSFLRTIQRPDYPHGQIDEESSLIESGLIDSLALLQIVTYLEETYNMDFREIGFDPAQLRSVGSILDLIARELKS